MKKLFCMFFLSFLLPLAGCGTLPGPGALFATPTPEPTPTPVPTPVPVVALFNARADEAFSAAVKAAADEAGFWFSAESGDASAVKALSYDGACCAIVYVDENAGDLAALSGAKVPVLLYRAGDAALPSGFPAVVQDVSACAKMAFEATLAYPPHDTPVRLLGVFASREGAAYSVWDEAVDAGKVLVKGVYAEADGDAAAWMEEQLSDYYPGMVDGVYAETGALAAACAEALAKRGRDDMEVFSAGGDGAVFETMKKLPAILVAAAGVLPEDAGNVSAERAMDLLTDGGNTNVTMLSGKVYAAGELG